MDGERGGERKEVEDEWRSNGVEVEGAKVGLDGEIVVARDGEAVDVDSVDAEEDEDESEAENSDKMGMAECSFWVSVGGGGGGSSGIQYWPYSVGVIGSWRWGSGIPSWLGDGRLIASVDIFYIFYDLFFIYNIKVNFFNFIILKS